jgi:hypothetical protein
MITCQYTYTRPPNEYPILVIRRQCSRIQKSENNKDPKLFWAIFESDRQDGFVTDVSGLDSSAIGDVLLGNGVASFDIDEDVWVVLPFHLF